ncbi:uncharacterized protein BJ212DRAFT_1355137 [Suillus subaureus]|uniref:Uncharacterized protein n=1 Tax=Suillus subaureus TaxID=48587 RepID=A0A9P7EBU1_9AGAM|nr:uncharacterized protein BJ212DRAFT_1355137 [Suillus subaureus]KAG1816514.1 hypothetical protein BJ212DRAFT_1355137 [Suillus subaureus]
MRVGLRIRPALKTLIVLPAAIVDTELSRQCLYPTLSGYCQRRTRISGIASLSLKELLPAIWHSSVPFLRAPVNDYCV